MCMYIYKNKIKLLTEEAADGNDDLVIRVKEPRSFKLMVPFNSGGINCLKQFADLQRSNPSS